MDFVLSNIICETTQSALKGTLMAPGWTTGLFGRIGTPDLSKDAIRTRQKWRTSKFI